MDDVELSAEQSEFLRQQREELKRITEVEDGGDWKAAIMNRQLAKNAARRWEKHVEKLNEAIDEITQSVPSATGAFVARTPLAGSGSMVVTPLPQVQIHPGINVPSPPEAEKPITDSEGRELGKRVESLLPGGIEVSHVANGSDAEGNVYVVVKVAPRAFETQPDKRDALIAELIKKGNQAVKMLAMFKKDSAAAGTWRTAVRVAAESLFAGIVPDDLDGEAKPG